MNEQSNSDRREPSISIEPEFYFQQNHGFWFVYRKSNPRFSVQCDSEQTAKQITETMNQLAALKLP